MTTELIAMLGGSASGFIFKLIGQLVANQQNKGRRVGQEGHSMHRPVCGRYSPIYIGSQPRGCYGRTGDKRFLWIIWRSQIPDS